MEPSIGEVIVTVPAKAVDANAKTHNRAQLLALARFDLLQVSRLGELGGVDGFPFLRPEDNAKNFMRWRILYHLPS
jgi:hypothetical protein